MGKMEANSSLEKEPVSLDTMLGSGNDFIAKGKNYRVDPIALEHVSEFMKDNLSIGSQLFNVVNENAKEKVDKWMSGIVKDGAIVRPGYCYDEDGNPVNLEKAMKDHWDIIDLKNFFKKLCDLSG